MIQVDCETVNLTETHDNHINVSDDNHKARMVDDVCAICLFFFSGVSDCVVFLSRSM